MGTTTQGIYVASRASDPERPAMWRLLRDAGIPIISSWIDEAGPGETADLGELWARIEREVRSAQFLVLYVEPDDFPLKGALIEVGMAIAAGVPVRVVAPGVVLEPRSLRPLGSWLKHPLVTICSSLHEATLPSRALPQSALSSRLVEEASWRCFHCGEVFTTEDDARAHFGGSETDEPGCTLNLLEGGLLKLYRDAEDELRRYRQEDHEASRTFYALGSDHARALMREEEKGYERGLRDGREAAALGGIPEGWRTIDSAPKDGTRMLLAKIVGHPDHPTALWWATVGMWSAKWDNWNDGIEPCGLADPSHWMPISARGVGAAAVPPLTPGEQK